MTPVTSGGAAQHTTREQATELSLTTLDTADAIHRLSVLVRADTVWWEQPLPSESPNSSRIRYNPADPNSHSSSHRCCADQPPIDENAWIRYGQVTDTAGQRYTQYGQPIIALPADRCGDFA
jgi:hypothetical protein